MPDTVSPIVMFQTPKILESVLSGPGLISRLRPTRVEYHRRAATWAVGLALTGFTCVAGSHVGANSILGEVMFLASVCLSAIAGSGRMWSKVYISGYKSHALVTEGPYSLCRNPLYLCSAAGMLGMGLATCTFTIPIVLTICFCGYYRILIADEEKRLLELHGAAYAAYLLRTPRFLPRLSGFREPASYTIHPRSLRRHLADVIWFPIIVGLVHIGVHLHDRGLLPTWWWLY